MAGELSIVGENFGRNFVVGERIAQGGFGSIYKAREATGIEDQYAIKIPRPLNSRRARQVLIREAEIQAGFADPHIASVEVHDVFTYEDRHGKTRHTPGIVTRLADTTLFQQIDTNTTLPLDTAISIIDDVASAYTTVHQAGFVYGDAAPSNVLLRREPSGVLSAEITDFGRARPPQREEQYKFPAFGIPMYSAPETFEGIITDASDQFGWAAGIGYPAITNEAPWDENDPPYDLEFYEYDYRPPRSFREIMGSQRITPLHEAIEKVAERALRERPSDRYSSMTALLDDLRLRLAHARE
jgi:serine/threonine protein kinase